MSGHANAAKRRVGNACRSCRQRKVKCSGIWPCATCVNRGQQCIYDEVEKRVVILERHLRALQRRAATAQCQLPPDIAEETSHPLSAAEDESAAQLEFHALPHDDVVVHETLSTAHHPSNLQPANASHGDAQSVMVTDASNADIVRSARNVGEDMTNNSQTYMASLLTRVYHILQPAQIDELHSIRPVSYGRPTCQRDCPGSDPVGTPSKDYIIHLAWVSHFHLKSNLCFFNRDAFVQWLERGLSEVSDVKGKLWHVTLHLTIALGKLFLEKGSLSSDPPGLRDFYVAIDHIPRLVDLIQESLQAMEMLCLLVFYAQAVSLNHIAYAYAGQATRLLKMGGFSKLSLSSRGVNERSRHVLGVCWTVFALDRMTSASLGLFSESELPISVPPQSDSDLIDLPDDSLFMNLRITGCLTRLFQGKSHDDDTGELTHTLIHLQKLGQHMKKEYQLCQDHTLSSISKEVATLHLSYCNCIIMMTTPTMLQVVQQSVRQNHASISWNGTAEIELRIIQTCINAASLALNIITVLYEESLFETFSALGRDITFLAAVTLVLASLISVEVAQPALISKANHVLGSMSEKGNMTASQLKGELGKIESLVSKQAARFSRETSAFAPKTSITMTRDGEVLGNFIEKVVDLHPAHSSAPASGGWRSSFLGQQSSFQPTRGPTAVSPGPRTADQTRENPVVAPADDVYLFGDYEAGLTSFDMEDLQWLDSVQ